MSEIERLRQQLRESRQREEEAQRLVLAAQELAEEERRQKEEAQELAKPSQLQTLQPYLEACHSLSLAIQVVTNRSLTTQGDTTNATGRIYPRRIIPWNDFATKQEEIWDRLSINYVFYS
jgi:hypothetical protein